MLPNNKNVVSSKCYGCSEFPLKLLFSIAYLTETTPKQFVAKSLLGCKIVLDTPDSTSTILNKRFNSNWKIFTCQNYYIISAFKFVIKSSPSL